LNRERFDECALKRRVLFPPSHRLYCEDPNA
jgi:hypothetical protein